MNYYNGSTLSVKSALFSDRIIKMVQYLHEKQDNHLSPLYQQVLRSGTSISANIEESRFASSKADFVNKLRIALKEASETRNWLLRLRNACCLTETQYQSMEADLSEVIAMLVSSINTASNNKNDKNIDNNQEGE